MAAVILGYRSLNLPHALRVAAATSKSIQKLKTLKFNQRFSRISSVTLAGCGGIFAMYLWNDSADCASNNDKNRNISFPSDPVEFFQKYYQQYSDQINQLGFSGFAGAFSGYAFKRISKEIAFAIGGVFMFLQVDFISFPNFLKATAGSELSWLYQYQLQKTRR
jgi:hypothetical protein